MNVWVDSVLVTLVLTNLVLLGSGQIQGCIRVGAVQGLVLGLLPVVVHQGGFSWRVLLLILGSVGLKGLAFPWLLTRSIREANVHREVEPFVGYTLSIVAGIASLAISLWLASRLALARPAISTLVVPVALSTIMVGLFLIVSRKKAVSQVIGYIVLENGIYTFGIALVGEIPALVELGLLMDVFVAVFVMGIAIYHINREFEHIDVHHLNVLKG